MAYVDLNPIRAGMADSLSDSLHTSIHARLADLQGQPFVPVLAPVAIPVVTPEVIGEIAHLPALALPGLLPEAELASRLKSRLNWLVCLIVRIKNRLELAESHGFQLAPPCFFHRGDGDRLHAAVFTPRAGKVHVISLRKANRREVKHYEQKAQP